MKKLICLMIALALCIGGLLVYRNQKIHGTFLGDGFQTVTVAPSFLIEEPYLEFELPEDSRIQFHHVTTDWFVPVLALYDRHAVQTVTLAALMEEGILNAAKVGYFNVYETAREYPIEFECHWSVLESTDKAEVSMAEYNQYVLYRILTQEKEIIVQFDPEYLSELHQMEMTECVMENYTRLSK